MQRRTIPPHVEAATRTALEKLPADRFATAAEFAAALGNTAFAMAGRAGRDPGASGPRSAGWTRPLLAAGAGAALLAAGTMAGRVTASRGRVPAEPVRFALVQPDTGRYTSSFGPSVALSPDGRTIAYTGNTGSRRMLFVRRLDALQPVPVPGTDGAYLPFFSPDGAWLGFVANQLLMKVALAGGAPVLIAALEGNVAQGAAWGPEGTIVLEDVSGLSRVSANGGALTRLTSIGAGGTHEWPSFLPDGRVLFTITSDTTRPAVVDLRTAAVTVLDVVGNTARYVAPGYLLVSDEGGTVTARPFDLRRLRVTGEAAPVLQGVDQGDGEAAKFAVTGGIAVHVAGQRSDRQLLFMDRGGRARAAVAEQRRYFQPRFSPDGRHIAVTVASRGGGSDVWVVDPSRGVLQRVTFTDSAASGEWTPDGRRIVFSRARGPGDVDVFWTRADGSGGAESLLVAPRPQFPRTWTPDGRTLLYATLDTATGWDIMALDLDGRTTRPVVQARLAQLAPTLSPDGRWLAYVSNESGRREVFVRPFPEGDGRWQISADGGIEPRWGRAGREIIYRSADRFIAVPVQIGPGFVAGRPDTLFRSLLDLNINVTTYDVTRDGQRFVAVGSEAGGTEIVVTLNPLAAVVRP